MDSTIISVIALVISIISFAISIYQSGIDRNLQFEQLRGNLLNELTAKGLKLATETQQLLAQIENNPEDQVQKKLEVVRKLTRIAEGFIEMRKSLKALESPPFFSTSKLLTKFTPIESELNDLEIIFDELFKSLKNKNLNDVNSSADGIIKRLFGSSSKNLSHLTSVSSTPGV